MIIWKIKKIVVERSRGRGNKKWVEVIRGGYERMVELTLFPLFYGIKAMIKNDIVFLQFFSFLVIAIE